MVFSLFCILVGSPLAPPPPPNKRFKLCFKAFFSLIQCKKRVLKVLKTWYFSYCAFWSAGQWGGAIAPPPPGYATANYTFLRKDSPTNAGGVGLYIKQSMQFRLRNDLSLNLQHCEDLWIELETIVTAPICFICPTKFSNSALLFGSYFDVLVCASLCFLIFARFVSTPNFRHNAQLFCFFLPSSSVQSLISFWDSKQTDVLFL